METPSLDFDEIGYWSEVKLEIIENYARAYSTILAAQTAPTLSHVYIDAFAGQVSTSQKRLEVSFLAARSMLSRLIRRFANTTESIPTRNG